MAGATSPAWGYVRIMTGTILGGVLGFYVMHRMEISYKEKMKERLRRFKGRSSEFLEHKEASNLNELESSMTQWDAPEETSTLQHNSSTLISVEVSFRFRRYPLVEVNETEEAYKIEVCELQDKSEAVVEVEGTSKLCITVKGSVREVVLGKRAKLKVTTATFHNGKITITVPKHHRSLLRTLLRHSLKRTIISIA